MRRVTKENLIVQIDQLYKIKDEQGQLSINDEYTLQAYEMLLATMDSEPLTLHMGEAINVFNALTGEQLSEHVNNAGLGPMGASNVQVWTSKAGGRLEFISANGGCTLNIFPQPAPGVQDEMTPEMMRAVQLNSELGAYAAANLSGAYDLFTEFWKVACRAAMLNQK